LLALRLTHAGAEVYTQAYQTEGVSNRKEDDRDRALTR
jgi:hypothetical protein